MRVTTAFTRLLWVVRHECGSAGVRGFGSLVRDVLDRPRPEHDQHERGIRGVASIGAVAADASAQATGGTNDRMLTVRPAQDVTDPRRRHVVRPCGQPRFALVGLGESWETVTRAAL